MFCINNMNQMSCNFMAQGKIRTINCTWEGGQDGNQSQGEENPQTCIAGLGQISIADLKSRIADIGKVA
jgi:hypothetical protein